VWLVLDGGRERVVLMGFVRRKIFFKEIARVCPLGVVVVYQDYKC